MRPNITSRGLVYSEALREQTLSDLGVIFFDILFRAYLFIYLFIFGISSVKCYGVAYGIQVANLSILLYILLLLGKAEITLESAGVFRKFTT